MKRLKSKWKIEETETESLILSTFASPVLGRSHDPGTEPDQELVVIWLLSALRAGIASQFALVD